MQQFLCLLTEDRYSLFRKTFAVYFAQFFIVVDIRAECDRTQVDRRRTFGSACRVYHTAEDKHMINDRTHGKISTAVDIPLRRKDTAELTDKADFRDSVLIQPDFHVGG